jgi:F-type H+-transporting ATPase subunit O
MYLYLYLQIDPDIIGGMIVTVGERLVDMSVSSRMKTYSDILKQSL